MRTRGKPDQITASTRAQDGFVTLLLPVSRDFARSLDHLMTGPDPEGPHKSRVALRRMRTLLGAFKPILARKTHHDLTARLRRSFQTIAALRDADVLAELLDTPALHEAAATQRRKTRKALNRQGATRLARDIAQTFSHKHWHRKGRRAQRHAPMTALAAAALTRAWDAACAHGSDLRLLAPQPQHDLRKLLKTLRYLAEFFAPLWPGPAQAAFLATLRPLQDLLGQLNDAVMAAALGLDHRPPAGTLDQAQALWSNLLAQPRWWPQADSQP